MDKLIRYTSLFIIILYLTITKASDFKSCDTNQCKNNGICYQNVNDATLTYCSCGDDYYGKNCENKVEPLLQTIVYVLAAICGLILIGFVATIFFFKRKLRKCKDSTDSWTFGSSSTKPASPMYSHNGFAALDKKTSLPVDDDIPHITEPSLKIPPIAHDNHGFNYEIKAKEVNQTSTFQPIEEQASDDNRDVKDAIVDIDSSDTSEEIPTEQEIKVETTKADSVKVDLPLTDQNLKILNSDDATSGYSTAESHKHLIPPVHRRDTSQDGSDVEQNMNLIYRDYYADRHLNGYHTEPRKPHNNQQPRNAHQRMSPSPHEYHNQRYHRGRQDDYQRRDRSPSPTSTIESSRPGSRPISPTSFDFTLHPQRGYGYPTYPKPPSSHHSGHSGRPNSRPMSPNSVDIPVQRRGGKPHPGYDRRSPQPQYDPRFGHYPQQQRRRKTSEQSEGYFRPRSAADLNMLSYHPDQRRRARSVDYLDTIPGEQQVENIHTGRKTRISPNASRPPPQGRGIWARTAKDY